MKREFNAELFYRNLRFLTKKNKIKMSELETECGISQGYLAKLTKINKPNPSIELIISIANYLKISVDDLLYWDFEKEYENTALEKVKKFIIKLINETASNRISWCNFHHDDVEILKDKEDEYGITLAEYGCYITATTRIYIATSYTDDENKLKPLSYALVIKTSSNETRIAVHLPDKPQIGECGKELSELKKIVEKKSICADISFEINEIMTNFIEK